MVSKWEAVRASNLPKEAGLASFFQRRRGQSHPQTPEALTSTATVQGLQHSSEHQLSSDQLKKIQQSQPKMDDSLATILREAAVAFLTADAGGDGELDFDDFKKLLPPGASANEGMLREAFNMADANGNGKISKTEYFLWTLNVASRNSGMGGSIDKQFRQNFDKSGDGKLNMVEFVEAAEEFGFGSCAHDIFLELDDDESGLVSFQEIHEHLKSRPNNVSDDCKKFLTALSFDWCNLEADKVDRTPWCVDTPSTFRDTLNARLAKDFVKVSDLWALMQVGAKTKTTIKRPDFAAAVSAAGFVAATDGHSEMLHDIFDEVFDVELSNCSSDSGQATLPTLSCAS